MPPGLKVISCDDCSSPTEQTTQATHTSLMYVNSQTPILLQTAKAILSNPSQLLPLPTLEVRAILNSGSQRSYVTTRVHEMLSLKKIWSDTMIIKTFGTENGERQTYDVVEFGVQTREDECLNLTTVVVPHICDPVRAQPITTSKHFHTHLVGLDKADSSPESGVLDIDVLIGSDQYWSLVTRKISRGASGPTAIEIRLGWVLSGPVEWLHMGDFSVNFISTHSLRIDTFPEQESLDQGLRRFWELK